MALIDFFVLYLSFQLVFTVVFVLFFLLFFVDVVSAQSHIYAQVNLAVIANLNNINILDRTIADPTLVVRKRGG